MYIIGENIHIISPKVKRAVADKDAKFFQDLAVQMVEAGADAIDLNIGPQKKRGHEILPWLVEVVEKVVDVPLVFDTTNPIPPMRGPSGWRACPPWPKSSTHDWSR